MDFTLVSKCADSTAILSGPIEPVSRPAMLFCKGLPAGTVLETIGRVGKPLYVAKLAADLPIGSKLSTQ